MRRQVAVARAVQQRFGVQQFRIHRIRELLGSAIECVACDVGRGRIPHDRLIIDRAVGVEEDETALSQFLDEGTVRRSDRHQLRSGFVPDQGQICGGLVIAAVRVGTQRDGDLMLPVPEPGNV